MATNVKITALRPIALPHRTLKAGEALDFGNPQDLAFFVSRLRWSAFKIEAEKSEAAANPAKDAEIAELKNKLELAKEQLRRKS